MNDEAWSDLTGKLLARFLDAELEKENLDPEISGPGATRDTLSFNHEGMELRLIRENKPVVLEKKMHYSHRAGDTARVEYIYSQSEFTHKLRLYRLNDEESWDELNEPSLIAGLD